MVSWQQLERHVTVGLFIITQSSGADPAGDLVLRTSPPPPHTHTLSKLLYPPLELHSMCLEKDGRGCRDGPAV